MDGASVADCLQGVVHQVEHNLGDLVGIHLAEGKFTDQSFLDVDVLRDSFGPDESKHMGHDAVDVRVPQVAQQKLCVDDRVKVVAADRSLRWCSGW